MKLIFLIITLITFTIFFIEALIHFNIGKNGNDCNNLENEKHKYFDIFNSVIKIHIPTYYELVKISLIVLFFSVISGIISSYIIKYHLID